MPTQSPSSPIPLCDLRVLGVMPSPFSPETQRILASLDTLLEAIRALRNDHSVCLATFSLGATPFLDHLDRAHSDVPLIYATSRYLRYELQRAVTPNSSL